MADPIFDTAKHVGGLKVTSRTPDGRKVISKRPLGFVQQWIDSAGNITFNQLSAGSAVRTSEESVSRFKFRLEAGGFHHYLTCALRTRYDEVSPAEFPEGNRQPCSGVVMTERGRAACMHTELLIKRRREAYIAARDARRVESLGDVERRNQERHIQAVVESGEKTAQAVAKMAEIVERTVPTRNGK
jgi:hypothetical protein